MFEGMIVGISNGFSEKQSRAMCQLGDFGDI
jgi:hypothetical protein